MQGRAPSRSTARRSSSEPSWARSRAAPSSMPASGTRTERSVRACPRTTGIIAARRVRYRRVHRVTEHREKPFGVPVDRPWPAEADGPIAQTLAPARRLNADDVRLREQAPLPLYAKGNAIGPAVPGTQSARLQGAVTGRLHSELSVARQRRDRRPSPPQRGPDCGGDCPSGAGRHRGRRRNPDGIRVRVGWGSRLRRATAGGPSSRTATASGRA
jgi:hypothetical protein